MMGSARVESTTLAFMYSRSGTRLALYTSGQNLLPGASGSGQSTLLPRLFIPLKQEDDQTLLLLHSLQALKVAAPHASPLERR
jgi:ABC-type lipoprotein export system ATPase subunit